MLQIITLLVFVTSTYKAQCSSWNLSYGWLSLLVYSLFAKVHMSLKTARLNKNMAHLFSKDRGCYEAIFLGLEHAFVERGKEFMQLKREL